MNKWNHNKLFSNMLDRTVALTGIEADVLTGKKPRPEYHINNLESAAELFIECAKKGEPIYAYLDYDADGIGSCSNLETLCRAINVPVEMRVPRRFSDGYGLNSAFVDGKNEGLLITIDNGIAANEAIAKAKAQGLKVIVLDHHIPVPGNDGQYILPDADIIVDPHVTGGDCEEYCGAGLTLKFAKEVLKYAKLNPSVKQTAIEEMTAIAAISTMADSVPLVGENYFIVKDGLSLISNNKGPMGLQKLVEKLGFAGKIVSENVDYKIAPCINAYGRLCDNGGAVVANTLCMDSDNIDEIEARVQDMIMMNDIRKRLTEEAVVLANDYIEKSSQVEDNLVVVYLPSNQIVLKDILNPEQLEFFLAKTAHEPEGKNTALGIAGLIAGKIAEAYSAPCIALTDVTMPDGTKILKGSGRSHGDIDIKKLLDEHRDLIAHYGGHPAACGISIDPDKFNDFAHAVKDACPARQYESDDIRWDFRLPLNYAGRFEKDIAYFEPYGISNTRPVVCIENAEIPANNAVLYMGASKNHVKLRAAGLDLVYFNGAEAYRDAHEPRFINAVGTLGTNEYKGIVTTQLSVLDLEDAKHRTLDDREHSETERI